MCTRTSGLFCVCLMMSCLLRSSRCGNQDYNHSHSSNDQHDDDGSSDDKPYNHYFMRELFNKYGHDGLMTFEGFQHLLESLGLNHMISHEHKLLLHNHENHNHRRDAQGPMSKGGENPSESIQHFRKDDTDSLSQAMKSELTTFPSIPHGERNENTSTKKQDISEIKGNSLSGNWSINLTAYNEHQNVIFGNKCLTASEILHIHNINPGNDVISPPAFLHLCPAIVYQLDQNHCSELSSSNGHEHLFVVSHHSYHVWLYASLAVLAISICGLLSVTIIPIIQRVCYHILLQFLIGMAIGSLSGDALLHLLPHAMVADAGHGHHGNDEMHIETHNEETHVWKGFAALIGVYLFFLAERLLNLITSYRRMKQSAKAAQVPKFARALKRVDGEQSRVVGEKLSHHKHGSYGYKFDPAALEALERLNETPQEEKDPCQTNDKSLVSAKEEPLPSVGNGSPCHETGVEVSQNPDWDQNEPKPNEENDNHSSPMKPLHVDVTYLPSEKTPEPETPTEECHRETVVYRHAHDDHSYVVTVTDHHHHHHHHHEHNHEVPTSISAVAWMVVMGDGLHNFCDGLAIGAAFVSGVSGGLSTTLAVFCHELPHELGDFAMLLKAGMTVKQALLYNGLSSILCFIGMLIGVALGNVTSATTWIFAGAAGMFLYIALVDMLPELGSSSSHPGTSSAQQLAVQLGGISLGVSIMLLIAVYEHDLQNVVS